MLNSIVVYYSPVDFYVINPCMFTHINVHRRMGDYIGTGGGNAPKAITFNTSNDHTVECEHCSKDRIAFAGDDSFRVNRVDCTIVVKVKLL